VRKIKSLQNANSKIYRQIEAGAGDNEVNDTGKEEADGPTTSKKQ